MSYPSPSHILDITSVVDEQNGAPPTISSMLAGNCVKVEFFITKHQIENIPKQTEEEVSKYLMDAYVKKDGLKDQFLTKGAFDIPEGFQTTVMPPRYVSLLNSIFWTILVWYPLCCFIILILTSGSWFSIAMLIIGLSVLLFAYRKMIGISKFSKASTYGQKKKLN